MNDVKTIAASAVVDPANVVETRVIATLAEITTEGGRKFMASQLSSESSSIKLEHLIRGIFALLDNAATICCDKPENQLDKKNFWGVIDIWLSAFINQRKAELEKTDNVLPMGQ